MQTLKLTKKYETYPEYKDSGVEWLGKIPKDWEISKARKFISQIESGIWGDDPKQDNNDIKCLRVADFSFDRLTFNNVETIRNNPSLKHKKILRKGDILLEKSGGGEKTPVGRAIIFNSEDEMVCANFIDIVRVKKEIDSKFFTYQLYTSYNSKINIKSIKQNTGIQNLDIRSYFSEFYPLPEFKRQLEIVKFLDEKTTLIDQIMEKKEMQIELLKEKKTSFINDAINNIDGNKERLKYIASEENIKNELLSSDPIYIGLENIESNTGKYIPSVENISPESVSKVFYKNNVLFGKLRPYLAKVYSSEFSGICSGEFLVLKPKKEKIISKFLFYKLISKDFITKVNDSTYGSQMPRASWQFIGNQILVYPTLIEQKKIVDKLDARTKLYDDAINKVGISIEKLKELKISIISNVVTGKIKV